ncbi:unnamed protein product, partial [marine sediment metagenome]
HNTYLKQKTVLSLYTILLTVGYFYFTLLIQNTTEKC